MTDKRDGSTHDPRRSLPSLIHSPQRLAILSSLQRVESADFSDLRDAFDMTSAELSRQLAVLEDADMIEVLKKRRNRKVITQARLSEYGRAAFGTYVRRLTQLIEPERSATIPKRE